MYRIISHIIGDSHRLIAKSNEQYLLKERERLYFILECIFSKKKFQSHSLFNKVIVRDIEKNTTILTQNHIIFQN